MDVIHVGARFYSYQSLDLAIKNFGERNNIIFWKRDTKRLELSKQIRRVADAPAELKYYSIRYTCIGGGRPHRSRTTTGKRKVKTFKQGCPVFIKVLLSKDSKSLEINEMEMEHNHLLSRELYESLPRVRRLSSVWQERVRNCMNLKVKKKLVLQAVIEETGKQVTLKDLHNIRDRYRKLDQKANEESMEKAAVQNDNNEIYPYDSSVENDSVLEQDISDTFSEIKPCAAELQNDMPQMSQLNHVCASQSENDNLSMPENYIAYNAETNDGILTPVLVSGYRIQSENGHAYLPCIPKVSNAKSENDVPEAISNLIIENIETNVPQIPKATSNGPCVPVSKLNQPIKVTSIFHSSSESDTCLKKVSNPHSVKKRKFMEDEAVQKLVDNQQETNREIKIMNSHLAEIVQILKRIETKLSTSVNDV